ncbi:MAG TPA: reverse transcriptase family protein [Planctomycetaceae bacterium]|jgi:RNA-directed DNA polymerase|nr:reverse transcriptase family protein [Planctomycetaceae bacterium]
MHVSDSTARDAATALLAGDWTGAGLSARLMQVFDLPRRQRWIDPLITRVFARFGVNAPTPRHSVLATFLAADRKFCRAVERLKSQALQRIPLEELESEELQSISLTNVLCLPRSQMAPAPAIKGTERLPALVTPGDLADWLGITLGELDWFAGCHRHRHRIGAGKLEHYRYYWIAKSGGRKRLVESPKPRLKEIQRQILSEILDVIPPHPSAHAFRSQHSTLTCAAPHVGQRVILRIDLRDFFPRIRQSRIHSLFHALGYPEAVARLLARLCTNVVSADLLPTDVAHGRRHDLWQAFGKPHLPQGAPTSPALANLCAYRLDCRLTGLVRSVGASYTRYADDLVFSGDHNFERSLSRFRVFVCALVLAEGFVIRHRKTRVMRSGTQQSITGLVVNRQINVPRDEYDRLKATLHNCRRFGPESQNRAQHPRFRDHLLGKIAYVRMTHPERGARIQQIFDKIAWGPPDNSGANE